MNSLFEQLKALDTEQINLSTSRIDQVNTLEMVRLMNAEDAKVAGYVQKKEKEIAEAIDVITSSFRNGGRLIYCGAGTSGRIAITDASECPPTFGVSPDMVTALIAGGKSAVFQAVEGAEDNPEAGAQDLDTISINHNDVVCGLAASGRTPYVAGALHKASSIVCRTILICCVPASQLPHEMNADIIIDIPVGPEVIAGSTRLKSGTAQKMVCNMLTTGSMILLGKTYGNIMVDLQLSNKKLVERARRVVMDITGLSYAQAVSALKECNGHVKTAILMGLTGLSAQESSILLNRNRGRISAAVESIHKRP
ncbi:MAG: N-acetylmuramic acid 6-phosphate etherase [Balneolales bacterium]|nr:N-acetylmuramic acid 6-phosphate etherase [Balneolales bacterium]